MSVAVLQSSSSPLDHWEKYKWPAAVEYKVDDHVEPPVDGDNEEEDEQRPGQFDIWSAIQAQKANSPTATDPPTPYVHPLLRRSSSLMSQKSLEICTESLGSETGSDDFSSFCEDLKDYNSSANNVEAEQEEQIHDVHDKQQQDEGTWRFIRRAMADEESQVRGHKWKELTSVNYHCSIGRRSPPRSFPPPLSSISRRDGPCLHMRPHRRDGRLVLEAVPVPSQNYLHAQREGGRLLLSFIDATIGEPNIFDNDIPELIEIPQEQVEFNKEEEEEIQEYDAEEMAQLAVGKEEEELEEKNHIDEEGEEEEEEEEVEVVDRGTVVEVKVSTQPQQQSGAMKVHRSSLVINKFVGGTPLDSSTTECDQPVEKDESKNNHTNNSISATATPAARRALTSTIAAAAAVVAASTISMPSDGHGMTRLPAIIGDHSSLDNKLLFTSKRRNREELLHNMRRCSQLRRPLFIWEPCCIATSS